MIFKTIKTVALAALLASTPVVADGVKLCHIANAGFLMEGKDAAVLFDAARIRDEYDGEYGLPSDDLMRQLTPGTGAFEKVKLALVSHKHNDHFDPEATLNHLRADADVTYLMPPEAFDMLKEAGLTTAEEARVKAVLPPWEGDPLEYDIGGIKARAYRVDHGPGRPQNIGFHVMIDGVSFFHTGDIIASAESLRKAGLSHTPVDVMLMPFWYGLGDDAQMQAVKGAWDVATMVPMHLPPGERGWMSQFGGHDGFMDALYGQWPGSVRLTDEMACQTFGVKG